MASHKNERGTAIRLIETWDVLKWEKVESLQWKPCMINRNMRCIEIKSDLTISIPISQINRNMRCIEITKFTLKFVYFY